LQTDLELTTMINVRRNLIVACCGAILLLTAAAGCTALKRLFGAGEKLPEIIANHPDREQFTALNGKKLQWQQLFNGKDLSGWYTFTKYGRNNDVEHEFTVEDGALHFVGAPMGYLCTNASYKNYYLRVVFRWGDKRYPPRENVRRDSGILYHFKSDAQDVVWPTSIECQIQEDDCGDYFFVRTDGKSPNKVVEGSYKRYIRTANYEKPIPEWNTIEVICLDNKSEHYVNGHLVNHATDLSVSEGKILLQLECAEVFYREVALLPLK